MTSRLGAFAAVCRRSLMVRQIRCKQNHFSAFFHNSLIRLDEPIEIKMPSLSPTMTEGTIVRWLKKEGDTISPGDVLCEIQTDKAIVGLEVEEEGVLLKILIPEDSKNIQLGEVIAVIGSEGSTYEVPAKTKRASDTGNVSVNEKTPSAPQQQHRDVPKLLGPSVRKLLQEYDINFSKISCSGPQNNILKADVLNYINAHNLKPQLSATEEAPSHKPIQPPLPKLSDLSAFNDLPVSSMRKTIARRLSEAKSTIPHAYISIDCSIGKIINLRKNLKRDGINVSVNDFIIKSVASALCKVPNINVINSNGNAVLMKSVDISVAVATENGLITPIVKNANNLSIQEISDSVKVLASKAREGKLRIEEFQGGSFTISNLGMYGITEFSAVINPPQGAILAIGTTRLIIEENCPVQKMTVTLSFDCRLIDEQDAGQFLMILKRNLEDPANILL